ncbi:MAG: hypothetical protein ACODAA_01005 [Gemmatimonadota bacterium]
MHRTRNHPAFFRAPTSLLVGLLLFPASSGVALAQDAPAAVRADRDRLLARADSVRAALHDVRPPGAQPTDWVDVAGFPLRVVGAPLDLALVRFPAFVAGRLTLPRPPGFLVRAYRRLGEAGIHPTVRSSIGPRSGLAAGVLIRPLRGVRWESVVSLRGSQRHALRGRLYDHAADAGAEPWLEAEVAWRRDAQAPFYGTGPDTPDLRTLYRREVGSLLVDARLPTMGRLQVDLIAGLEDNHVDRPLNTDADETARFDSLDASTLFGLEDGQRYARFGVSGELDFTKREAFRASGARLSAGALLFRGIDGTSSNFHRMSFEAQGLVPINERQQLALRGLTELARGRSGEIPFYHLSTLGGERTAIGYTDGRFADLDMISLSSEWRYEVWRDIHNSVRLESFVHAGVGAVGRRVDEIETDDWQPSYGFGFRFADRRGLLGLAFLGFSDESFQVGVGGEWRP